MNLKPQSTWQKTESSMVWVPMNSDRGSKWKTKIDSGKPHYFPLHSDRNQRKMEKILRTSNQTHWTEKLDKWWRRFQWDFTENLKRVNQISQSSLFFTPNRVYSAWVCVCCDVRLGQWECLWSFVNVMVSVGRKKMGRMKCVFSWCVMVWRFCEWRPDCECIIKVLLHFFCHLYVYNGHAFVMTWEFWWVLHIFFIYG